MNTRVNESKKLTDKQIACEHKFKKYRAPVKPDNKQFNHHKAYYFVFKRCDSCGLVRVMDYIAE